MREAAQWGHHGGQLSVFRDPASLFAEAAHYERLRSVIRRLAGRRLRYREAVVLTARQLHRTNPRWASWPDVAAQGAPVQLHRLDLTSPAQMLDEVNAYRPEVLSAYGSVLEALLLHVREHDAPFAAPRVAVYGADAMSPAARRWAAETLGIEILSNYGAIEAPNIGFECERHRGYHLSIDLQAIRLLDQEGWSLRGAPGELVVSNLVNRGTVLLNYRVGDVATQLEEPCGCGRSLPLLAYLERTKLAWLDLGDGATVHAQAFRFVLHPEPSIWRFQVEQTTRRGFVVRLVPGPECDHAAVSERITKRLREQLPADASVRVEFAADLPRTPSGKVQPIVALDRQ